jgi:hypothetical protein
MNNDQILETNNKKNDVSPKKSNAKEIVLQWLTYSFWFWLLLIIGILLSSSLSYFVGDKNGDYSWTAYMLAPLLVLLPISITSDHFYKKIESIEKHGFSSVVMVISAVLACLIAVGSLITVLVSVIGLIIDTGEVNDKAVVIISSLVASTLSTLLFGRIMYLEQLSWIRKKFSLIVGIVFAITLLLTIVGPMTYEISRKSDRLVESKYYDITREIEDHANSKKELPESLSDVKFDSDTQDAIDTGNITYEKLETTNDDYESYNEKNLGINESYKLCVVWKYENKDRYDSYSRIEESFSNSHNKGKQCYTEKFYSYNY